MRKRINEDYIGREYAIRPVGFSCNGTILRHIPSQAMVPEKAGHQNHADWKQKGFEDPYGGDTDGDCDSGNHSSRSIVHSHGLEPPGGQCPVYRVFSGNLGGPCFLVCRDLDEG